jgi:hypothetical protein
MLSFSKPNVRGGLGSNSNCSESEFGRKITSMGVIENYHDNLDFKAGVGSTPEMSCTLIVPQTTDNIQHGCFVIRFHKPLANI